MDDAPNRILMAALDYNFSLHWSHDSVTQEHEKSQLSSSAATTCAPLSFNQKIRFYRAQHLVHQMPSRCFSPLNGAPAAAFPPRMGAREGLVPEWAKESAVLLLRRQVFPSKQAIRNTALNTGWGRAQLAQP